MELHQGEQIMPIKCFCTISAALILAVCVVSCIYIQFPPEFAENNQPEKSVVDVKITVAAEGGNPQVKTVVRSYSVVQTTAGTIARSGRDPVTIKEDFSSSTINPAFCLDGRGKCDWRVADGVLTMDQGGSPSDAGLLKIWEPLDVAEEMTIKVKARAYNYGGPGPCPNCCPFSLAQATGQSGDIIWADGVIVCTIYSDERFVIAYRNENSDVEWHPGVGWEKATGCSFKTDPTEYYIIEFRSNGDDWRITVKDKNGKMLTETSPVSWRLVRNANKAWYFNMGEASVGYYFCDMDVDYVYAEYTPKNDRYIIENFDSGVLEKHFILENAGETCWKISDGSLSMKQTGRVEDAGIVLLKDNLDIAKPMVIKTKTRFRNATMNGWYGYSMFCIGQDSSDPGIIRGFNGQIHICETPEGNIRIIYDTADKGVFKCWHSPTQRWEVCTPEIFSYKGPGAAYHIAEFYSDGKEFYIVIKDDSGKVLVKTSPVKWSDVENLGPPYQFYFGEWSTGYYSADMDVDYIHASYSIQTNPGKF
jgi:hypothetical protein